MVWIVDEKKIFAVNKNLDIQIKKVGDDKVIVVDNFYKDPEAVRHLILNSPSTTWKNIVNNLPGARTIFGLNTTILRDVSSTISEKHFNTQVFDLNFFISNLYIQTYKPAGINCKPHTDTSHLAGLIYLNTPEECHGGTAFYKSKHTNSQYNTSRPPYETMVPYTETLTESDENWELIDIVEMKYNRYLLYPGSIYHSPYIKKEWFTDYYRINQTFFFSTILNGASILRLVKYPLIEETEDNTGKKYTHIRIPNGPKLVFKNFDAKIISGLFSLIDGQRNFGQIRSIIASNFVLNKIDLAILKKVLQELFASKTLISFNG
jgi:hypothetical protein